MKLINKTFTILILTFLIFFISCAHKETQLETPEQKFNKAKLLYADEDYSEAIQYLKQFALVHSATKYADDAQFMLAESYYNREEYLLAATEYRFFIRKFPNSELLEDARYKLGLCYYNLSPKAQLDQTYTKTAMKEFNRYVVIYGDDGKYTDEIKKYMQACRNKFAKKAYKNGYIYRKSLKEYEAARIYYQKVLNDYFNSEWVDDAIFGIAETYKAEKKWDKAIENYKKVINESPDTELVAEAKEKIKECNEEREESNDQPQLETETTNLE